MAEKKEKGSQTQYGDQKRSPFQTAKKVPNTES